MWWEVAPVQFTPLFPADGRFRGSPQVTQVRLLALLPSLTWPRVGGTSPHLPKPRHANQTLCLSLVLQPGKLTEAFKYFLQGMGYK